jgi:predicted nucleic acid-binding protein
MMPGVVGTPAGLDVRQTAECRVVTRHRTEPLPDPLIYAEVSVGYESIEELDELLPASDYEREPLPCVAGFAAGKAYLRHRHSGGDKRSPMPDFYIGYIGAHAAVAGYRLLTRDVRRYRAYFPTVQIVAPGR